MAEQAAEGGVATMEPLMEEDEEEGQSRGSSTAGRLVPLQVPELEEGRPMGPRFWHSGQDAQEAGWEPPTSEKARGKAPTVELLPPEMDEELVQWLHQEEIAAEEM